MSGINKSRRIATLSVQIICCIIIASSISKINSAAMNEKEVKFDEAEALLSGKILDLAKKLHKTISSADDKQNGLFSPLSIHAALSMLSAGIKPDSPSGQSLLKVLGYKDVGAAHAAYGKVMNDFRALTQASEQIAKDNKGISDLGISILNSRPPVLDFWTMGVSNKIHLNDEFKDTLLGKYNTSMRQVASQGDAAKLAGDVNKWAKQAGFAADIVQSSDLELKNAKDLMLLSAVRIQGWWVNQMAEYDEKEVFYNYGDPKQLVNGTIISNYDFSCEYVCFSHENGRTDEQLDKLEFRMARIPLVGGMSFTIIEPLKNGSLDHLAQLESALLADGDPDLLEKALQKMKYENFRHLQFPKIKFENNIDLKKVFEKLELGDLFDENRANLLNIASDPMVLSRAKHQAVIEVDKSGLKGGALTQMEISVTTSLRDYDLEVNVKNPFLFMVRYKSLTLFIGKLVKI